MTHELLTSGIAALAMDADGDGQLPVSGVLIGEDDITNGMSGKRTRWPAGVLEAMVGLFEGKPLTMADSLDPEQHVGIESNGDGARVVENVTMDDKVGEITGTAYEDGVGLLFEGFLADWEAEDVVERGLAQVSPVVARDLELVEGDPDEGDALYEPTEVTAARDVAIVADGAAPSNDITAGALPDMDATAEALSSHFTVEVEALADGGMEVTTTGSDDGPHGGSGPSSRTQSDDWRTQMTDELTDKELELLALARQRDDPVVVEADEYEELAELNETVEEHEDLIDAAADLDDPEVASAEELEAMQERLATVEAMFDEALAEQRGLRETTIEAMSFEAKASEFETDDGEFDIEALSQSPESGSAPVGGGDNGPSKEDKERIEQIELKLDKAGSALPQSRVEALQDEAAELAGTDDYDAALEVL